MLSPTSVLIQTYSKIFMRHISKCRISYVC